MKIGSNPYSSKYQNYSATSTRKQVGFGDGKTEIAELVGKVSSCLENNHFKEEKERFLTGFLGRLSTEGVKRFREAVAKIKEIPRITPTDKFDFDNQQFSMGEFCGLLMSEAERQYSSSPEEQLTTAISINSRRNEERSSNGIGLGNLFNLSSSSGRKDAKALLLETLGRKR